jgi:hypothetical protein
MQRSRSHDQPEGLESLARQARNYALHMMRTTGSVPPTVIADTDDGYIFCMPTSLTNDAAKDRFADIARLMAIAYTARAIVMVVEAWATLPNANGHLDTETPPSQSPDRKEIVALMLEDHLSSATSLLHIMRNTAGQFIEFGEPGPLQCGETSGRISGLMSSKKPSFQEAAKAKAALQHLGMSVINGGFDPSLN